MTEYTIPVTIRVYDNGKKTMICPICHEEYEKYLLCLGGHIGCRYCLGRKAQAIVERMIEFGSEVIIDGVCKRLTSELAKLIGLKN